MARTKKSPTKPKRATKPAPRADFGKPIDSFFHKQPEPQRSILAIDGKMCALGSHKAHVNLILWGPPNAYKNPDGLLIGESKLGRHLKVTTVAEIPKDRVRSWLETCAHLVRTT